MPPEMQPPETEQQGDPIAIGKATAIMSLLDGFPDGASDEDAEELKQKIAAVAALTPEEIEAMPPAPTQDGEVGPQQHARGDFLSGIRKDRPLLYVNPTLWRDTGQTVGIGASGDAIRLWENVSTGATRAQISQPGTGRRTHAGAPDGGDNRKKKAEDEGAKLPPADVLAVHFYRQLFSDMELSGKGPSRQSVMAAMEELSPAGWQLARQADHEWHAVHLDSTPSLHGKRRDSLGRGYVSDRPAPGVKEYDKLDVQDVSKGLHEHATSLPGPAEAQAKAVLTLVFVVRGKGSPARIEELADGARSALSRLGNRSQDDREARERLEMKLGQCHWMVQEFAAPEDDDGSDLLAKAEANVEKCKAAGPEMVAQRIVKVKAALAGGPSEGIAAALEAERKGLEAL